MSKLVRAGIIALATVHQHYSVRAITLRTLLENQITAETNLQTATALELQEQAVLNVARDIQELSFAQIGMGTSETISPQDLDPNDPYGVNQAYVELAKQLVDISKAGDLETLKECIADVQDGTYQVSKGAKLAAGTYPVEEMDQGELLVRKLTQDQALLAPGETITGMNGETISVEPVVMEPAQAQATVSAASDPQVVEVAGQAAGLNEGQSDPEQNGETNEESQIANPDNIQGDVAAQNETVVTEGDHEGSVSVQAVTVVDGDETPQPEADAIEDGEDGWFDSWF